MAAACSNVMSAGLRASLPAIRGGVEGEGRASVGMIWRQLEG